MFLKKIMTKNAEQAQDSKLTWFNQFSLMYFYFWRIDSSMLFSLNIYVLVVFQSVLFSFLMIPLNKYKLLTLNLKRFTSLITIIPFQKEMLQWSVKRFQNYFLEISQPSKYWTKKHNPYFKWNNIWFTDEDRFEIKNWKYWDSKKIILGFFYG